MADDPWMPKVGAEGWLVPLDSPFGYKRDNDIFPVVYALRSWPPPRGPVPPGEGAEARDVCALTLVGAVEFSLYREDLVPAAAGADDRLPHAEALHARRHTADG